MPTCVKQQCDEPGIQEFYEDNFVCVYRFVFNILRNREEAEKLTSQIFLKTLRFLGSDPGFHNARNWLFRIAYTTINDYWHDCYQAPTGSLDMRLENDQGNLAEEAQLAVGCPVSVGEAIPAKGEIAAERIRDLLQELPEQYREVLSYRFLLNLSIRETAATLGVPEADAIVLQFRAIKHATTMVSSIATA